MNINDILIGPIVTEKSTMLKNNAFYTFEVNKHANKLQIMQAIKAIFKVEVEDCKVINQKPKVKMLKKRRGYGKTKFVKKAIVKLKKGQSIGDLDS